MSKNFVLDTNILLHDPRCFLKFDDNNLFIPHEVIEELDGLKGVRGETGYAAREAQRNLKKLRGKGNLFTDGAELPKGGRLSLFVNSSPSFSMLPNGWNSSKMDNLILLSVLAIEEKYGSAILVTNDVNMQLKADAMNIAVQEYKNDRIKDEDNLYSGKVDINISVPPEYLGYKEEVIKYINEAVGAEEREKIPANAFVVFHDVSGATMLGKYDGQEFLPLQNNRRKPYDIFPRNMGQIFLQEALFSDKPLVICNGPAGTGKTLLSLACGLEQVTEQRKYNQIVVTRANIIMDKDIGFLPGDEESKIDPLIRGIYDNLGVLLGNKDDTMEEIEDKIDEIFDRRYIDTQFLGFFRGRSISNSIVIVDEAQNCTPSQILTICTRAGQNTKIVLIGDTKQIDNPQLDIQNNGLSFAIERMKGAGCCEIVTFTEDESNRSELAKEAAQRLSGNL